MEMNEGWNMCNDKYYFKISMNLEIRQQQTCIYSSNSTNIMIQDVNEVTHCSVVTPWQVSEEVYEMSHNPLSGL